MAETVASAPGNDPMKAIEEALRQIKKQSRFYVSIITVRWEGETIKLNITGGLEIHYSPSKESR